jgi:5'(3')-deoxyribonucleotidase
VNAAFAAIAAVSDFTHLPLRIVAFNEKNVEEGRMEVSKIDKKKLADAQFTVPADFQVVELSALFDTYILSTSPWDNPSAWSDKLCWVTAHLGEPAYKRLILTHHKNLNRGDFIIDDRTKHGVDVFDGLHIHFGTRMFPDWPTVMEYVRPLAVQQV